MCVLKYYIIISNLDRFVYLVMLRYRIKGLSQNINEELVCNSSSSLSSLFIQDSVYSAFPSFQLVRSINIMVSDQLFLDVIVS